MNFSGRKTELVLSGVVILLAAILLTGTLWAFASGRARPGTDSAGRNLYGGDVPKPAADGKTAVFGDIGMLRAKTADTEPVTVVVSPFLPYASDDLAFREELVQKTRILRTSILGWFAARSLSEIDKLGEDGVKRELLAVINANLVMGRVEVLYFDEFMVLG